jgi:predicted transcriptional regulator
VGVGGAPGRPAVEGLGALRKAGTVSDLLFLCECETRIVTGLRPLAARLGLSVQAASHTYRGLARRGFVELRAGRYRATVPGIDWLHSALGSVRDDLAQRLDELHIVRTTPAIADGPIAAGARVSLVLRDGLLTASEEPGAGSRGTARSGGLTGEIVEVGDLQGIVPLPFGPLRVVTFARGGDRAPLRSALRRALSARPDDRVFTFGLEAHQLLAGGPSGGTVAGRFGVPAAVREATRLGVACTVVASDRDVVEFCRQVEGPDPPPTTFLSLGGGGRIGRRPARTRRQAAPDLRQRGRGVR